MEIRENSKSKFSFSNSQLEPSPFMAKKKKMPSHLITTIEKRKRKQETVLKVASGFLGNLQKFRKKQEQQEKDLFRGVKKIFRKHKISHSFSNFKDMVKHEKFSDLCNSAISKVKSYIDIKEKEDFESLNPNHVYYALTKMRKCIFFSIPIGKTDTCYVFKFRSQGDSPFRVFISPHVSRPTEAQSIFTYEVNTSIANFVEPKGDYNFQNTFQEEQAKRG